MKRAHVIFKGRVQGVFFRANTREKASELNLKGWVRNLYDGSVEAVIEGDEDKIKQLIDWCSTRISLARVDDVKIDWEDYKGEFKRFEVRY